MWASFSDSRADAALPGADTLTGVSEGTGTQVTSPAASPAAAAVLRFLCRLVFLLQYWISRIWHGGARATLLVYDSIMEPFYPHAWSLDSRCSYYCHYRPQHVLLAGDLTSKTFRQRKKCSQKLARVAAALVDSGVKHISLCDTRTKWHFENANQFMMALSYSLQELGYKPLVSFVNKAYDHTCFYDAPGSDSTDSDLDEGSSGVLKLKVLILSPAAERTDFAKADVLIDLLDRRHGHERVVEIVQAAEGPGSARGIRPEAFTVDSLIAELPGLCPDVSGKFCSFPSLCVLYSNHGYSNVAGIPPWLLRKAILANGGSLRHSTVFSTWRALKTFDKWMCSKHKG